MKNTKKVKVLSYGRQWIDKDDIREVTKVLKSNFLTQGPTIELFEKKIASYCGVDYAVAFSSGTAALHGACFAAGIGTEDEVITTPMTFAASANCVLYCGGKPVFADIKEDLPLIDPVKIEEKINNKTKAIISVDYAGIPVDYDEINVIAKKYKLIFISDAAHSLGAIYKGKKIGSLSDMTVFSFHPVKLITTGEGGMVVTDNKKFYERLRIFRTHGITKEKRLLKSKNEGDWFYEMQVLGFNYRLTDIQAALGISQFKKVSFFLNRRRYIAEKYQKSFTNNSLISYLHIPVDRIPAWHLFPVLLKLNKIKKNKKKVYDALLKKNIRTQVHYIPVHLHPFYRRNFEYNIGDYPQAENCYNREISLPIFPEMSDKDIDYCINTLLETIKNEI